MAVSTPNTKPWFTEPHNTICKPRRYVMWTLFPLMAPDFLPVYKERKNQPGSLKN